MVYWLDREKMGEKERSEVLKKENTKKLSEKFSGGVGEPPTVNKKERKEDWLTRTKKKFEEPARKDVKSEHRIKQGFVTREKERLEEKWPISDQKLGKETKFSPLSLHNVKNVCKKEKVNPTGTSGLGGVKIVRNYKKVVEKNILEDGEKKKGVEICTVKEMWDKKGLVGNNRLGELRKLVKENTQCHLPDKAVRGERQTGT